MKKRVRKIVQEKFDKMKGQINSMQEALSFIEEQAMNMTKFQDEQVRDYGIQLSRLVNRARKSDLDPESIGRLAKALKTVMQNKSELKKSKFSLFPAYSYLRDALER